MQFVDFFEQRAERAQIRHNCAANGYLSHGLERVLPFSGDWSAQRLDGAGRASMLQGMGSWGAKAFQNDAALDWVSELETGGLAKLRDTLSAVATTNLGDFVDVDDGARAVAAAEIVAAAFGSREALTQPLRTWVDANQKSFVDQDQKLALTAIERVLAANSELRELWEEDSLDSPWHSTVRGLLVRLGGSATPDEGAKSVGSQRVRGVSQRDRDVLVTFLVARGLELSPGHLARIEAAQDRAEMNRWLTRAPAVASLAELFEE